MSIICNGWKAESFHMDCFEGKTFQGVEKDEHESV